MEFILKTGAPAGKGDECPSPEEDVDIRIVPKRIVKRVEAIIRRTDQQWRVKRDELVQHQQAARMSGIATRAPRVHGGPAMRAPRVLEDLAHENATPLFRPVNQSVLDAHLLSKIYGKRQKLYRGATSPEFQFADSPLVLPNSTTNLTIGQAALSFELMLSPVAGQNRAPWGEGSTWFGVDSLIDPIDAAAFSSLLFDEQPDLIIEIGTECGGSAVFFATLMQLYNPAARVVTWDVTPLWKRCSRWAGPAGGQRRTHKGYRSALWQRHLKEGRIVHRIADIASTHEQLVVGSYVSNASNVWVIDDGDHFATPLLVHFHLFARFVSPGGLYLLADTRLERSCMARNRKGLGSYTYCTDLLGSYGGPARALKYLEVESPFFQNNFVVDRTPERWVFTQHPGGWLRRRRSENSPNSS